RSHTSRPNRAPKPQTGRRPTGAKGWRPVPRPAQTPALLGSPSLPKGAVFRAWAAGAHRGRGGIFSTWSLRVFKEMRHGRRYHRQLAAGGTRGKRDSWVVLPLHATRGS